MSSLPLPETSDSEEEFYESRGNSVEPGTSSIDVVVDLPHSSTVPTLTVPKTLNKMSSSSGLNLPDSLKLKGEENYIQWKDKVMDIAISHDLCQYVDSRFVPPKEVDYLDPKVDQEALKLWKEYRSGDAQMRLAITLNCKTVPSQVIQGKKTSMEMWNTLQKQYEGSGVVLKFQAVQDYMLIRYDDYTSLELFVIAFRKNIERLSNMGCAPPEEWHPIAFVTAVSNTWPVWAERQRSNLRIKNNTITLEALIEDLTDEARTKNKSGPSGSALYGQKGGNNKDKGGKGKGKGKESKDRTPCKHCGIPGAKHEPNDCLAVNTKKRKEWEEKNKKKWLKYDDWIKKKSASDSSNNKGKTQKSKEEDSGDEGTFGLVSLVLDDSFGDLSDHSQVEGFSGQLVTGSPVSSLLAPFTTTEDQVVPSQHVSTVSSFPGTSVLPVTSGTVRNRWLYDTGASEHVANDLSQYDSYEERGNLQIMHTANGPVRPLGIGTVSLDCPLSNGGKLTLKLFDVVYMPQSPINLLSGKKLMALGGYARNGMLLSKSDRELCQLDSQLLVIENPRYLAFVLPAAIEKAPIDIELWHRRFGHLGLETLRQTQNMVKGLIFQKKTPPLVTRVCDPCEKGRPLKFINKKAVRRATSALERVHLDVVHITPRGLGGENYATLFTDEATSTKWAYTFSVKSEAFDSVKQFDSYCRTQYQRFVKSWRLDGGREYSPKEMTIFADAVGQIIEIATPYNPHQDGKSERSLRTVMERQRPAHIDQNIPGFLWPQTFKATVYMMNRTASSVVENKTPYQAFMDQIEPDVDHVPSVAHLRVLGCKVYVLIEKERRVTSRKLAARAEVGILVGYEGTHIYQVYMPSRARDKIVRTSHVRFDEGDFVTAPDFEALGDLQAVPSQSLNRDVEQLRLGPPAVDHIDGSDDDSDSIQEQADETPPDVDEDDVVDAPDLSLRNPTTSSKVGRPKGSKNKTYEAVPPELRRTTRSQAKGHALTVPMVNWVNDLDNEDVSDKGDSYYLAFMAGSDLPEDPTTLKDALNRPRTEAEEWRQAVVKEYRSLRNKSTWKTVKRSSLPKGTKVLGTKLVFKTKRNKNGDIVRRKARLVVRGFEQVHGRDFDQTFAGVCKSASWKLAMALAAMFDLEIVQFDVETAFLNAKTDTEIYVELPPKWKASGTNLTDDEVALLLQALYGLKQSPRLWQNTLRQALKSLGFEPLVSDACVYINRQARILVVTYVDDFLAIAKKGPALDQFTYEFRSKFTIEELGDAEYFLGVRIVRDRVNRKLYLCQDAYIDKILERYGMTNCKPVDTPMASGALAIMVPFDGTASKKEIEEYGSIVGSLNYLACQTRCDIAFTVSVLSRFLTNPSPAHLKAGKRVLQYLKGTKYLSIVYGGDVDNHDLMKLQGYFDSDFAGDLHQRKSHSGSVFKLAGGVVSAVSKRQSIVAQSSTEAEYYSGAKAAQESEYLRQVLKELGYKGMETKCVELTGDNQGALSLAENPEFHQRTKHIAIRYHYLRDRVAKGRIELFYVPTDEMVADGLTKPLASTKHTRFVELLNLQELPTNLLRQSAEE